MFGFLFQTHAMTAADALRLRRIEQKLDALLNHLQVEFVDLGPGDALSEDVRILADRGDKIAAIKKHRELTGAGLKEAKDAVEA